MGKPKVRFKGFIDDWEQRKLGDVADVVGDGTPSTNKDEYWDGDIDWYAPAEIADQIYIESYFEKMDTLITLHQHKCDELKKLKKIMLQKQNMFL